MMPRKISVIICTRNRAACLRKALDSLADQNFPVDQFETLVIDNDSCDNTKNTVADFQKRHPAMAVHYIHEPVLGLSKARNTGLKEALGDYVAYLDDDAIALHGWLSAIIEAFTTPAPAPGCVGGKVEPIWEKPQPPWLGGELLDFLTILDLSPDPMRLRPDQWIAGANMAFDRRLLLATGGFPEYLGRCGSNLLSNEEILVRLAIEEKGAWCRYFPAMHVRHLVPADRLNKRWFLRRSFWQGISNELMQKARPKNTATETQADCAISAARLLGNCFYFLAPATDPRIFCKKCHAWAHLGKLCVRSGAYRLFFQPSQPEKTAANDRSHS